MSLVHTRNTLNVFGVRFVGGFPASADLKNVVGYFAEFLFKRKFPNQLDRIHQFFSAAAQLYPPVLTPDKLVQSQGRTGASTSSRTWYGFLKFGFKIWISCWFRFFSVFTAFCQALCKIPYFHRVVCLHLLPIPIFVYTPSVPRCRSTWNCFTSSSHVSKSHFLINRFNAQKLSVTFILVSSLSLSYSVFWAIFKRHYLSVNRSSDSKTQMM